MTFPKKKFPLNSHKSHSHRMGDRADEKCEWNHKTWCGHYYHTHCLQAYLSDLETNQEKMSTRLDPRNDGYYKEFYHF